jgi:hypothetical protein
MPFFDRLNANQVVVPAVIESEQQQESKDGAIEAQSAVMTDSDSESISKDAQAGVQKAEATTQVWSRSHLIAAYVM